MKMSEFIKQSREYKREAREALRARDWERLEKIFAAHGALTLMDALEYEIEENF